MTADVCNYVGTYNVDAALTFLGPAEYGILAPKGCLEYLVLLIKQIAVGILRILNLICGDRHWYDNQTARLIINLYIEQYTSSLQREVRLHEKICQLYEALQLRASGDETLMQGLDIGLLLSNQCTTTAPLIAEGAAAEPGIREEENAQQSVPAASADLQPLRRLFIDRVLTKAFSCAETAGKASSVCFYEIAKAQASTNPQEALATVNLMRGARPAMKMQAIIEIALQQAMFDLDQALHTVDLIEDITWKVKALCEMAKVQSSSNSILANALLERALATVSSHNESGNVNLMLEIATAQASINPDHALATAILIQNSHLKDKALFAIARSLAFSNPEQANTAASLIQEPLHKIKAFCKIAKEQAGNDTVQAESLLRKALEIKDLFIGYEWSKNEALFEIARVQALINHEQAIANADLIENSLLYDRTHFSIIEALACLNPRQALISANLIQDPLLQVKGLCFIANARMSTEIGSQLRNEILRQLMGKAQILVNIEQAVSPAAITRSKEEVAVRALCEIANSSLITSPEQLNDLFDQALAIAERIPTAHQRCSVYSLILRALAK